MRGSRVKIYYKSKERVEKKISERKYIMEVERKS